MPHRSVASFVVSSEGGRPKSTPIPSEWGTTGGGGDMCPSCVGDRPVNGFGKIGSNSTDGRRVDRLRWGPLKETSAFRLWELAAESALALPYHDASLASVQMDALREK